MWKQFRNTNYSISDDGKVKNIKTNRILSQWKHKKGYLGVTIMIDAKKTNFLVHRLVGECFIENFDPDLPVHHIDSIRNNNNLPNLQNITTLENNRQRIMLGRYISDIDFIIKIIELNDKKLTAQEIFTLIRDEYS